MNDFQFISGPEIEEITRLFQAGTISQNLYIAAINLIGNGHSPLIVLAAIREQIEWGDSNHADQ